MSETVILGAGLTGLASAYFLGKRPYVLFEKETDPGGLCRTRRIKKYLFDYTGHLLHVRNNKTKDLLNKLMPSNLSVTERKASVFSLNRYTDYPFQANLKGLPKEVIRDCILGFIKSSGDESSSPENLEEWFISTFGSEIAKRFMIPYNTKLWQRDLKSMSFDWVSWSVPRPTLEEVINGALGIPNREFGYNPRFSYPKEGGIASLIKSFAEKLNTGVSTGKNAVGIDPGKKIVMFNDGSEAGYERLLSTIPLNELVKIITSAPERIRELADGLKWVNVLDINLGVKRANLNGSHWVYFPEEKFPFYRVGFPANFCNFMAPPGCSTMYIEVSYNPDNNIDKGDIYNDCIDKLIETGILRDRREIDVSEMISIEPAYIVFDDHRKEALPEIMEYLEGMDVYSIGRYGSWDYLSMEDCILQAGNTVKRILK